MFKAILDTFVSSLYEMFMLFPYLYLTYLLMEYLEHKMSRRELIFVRKSKEYGPIIGGILGIIPQCGFSVSFANLYIAGLISLGTMLAIFLSTSDEMLPILISRGGEISTITIILLTKLLYAISVGLLIDRFLPQSFIKNKKDPNISAFCKQEKCKCSDEKENIYKSAFKHTEKICIFIFIFSFIVRLAFLFGDYEVIKGIMLNYPIMGKFIVSFVGLIPSCYPSVLLTELYLDGVISVATMITGTLSNSGLGLLVLYRVNSNKEETARIIALIYVISVILGIITEAIL